MYVKNGGDFQTEYITTIVPTNVAKIMTFTSKLSGTSTDSTFNRIQFRIYHGLGTNMIMKEYFIFANNGGIAFVDINPTETNKIECYIAQTDASKSEYGVFFKAGLTYADTWIQVIHAPVKSFFTFFNNAKYSTDPSTLTKIYPINNAKTDITFTYSGTWVDYDSTQTRHKSGITLSGKRVNLVCHAKSGTITDGSTVLQITDSRYYPIKNIFGTIIGYNGTTYIINGIYLISTTGAVMIYGVTGNSRVSFEAIYDIA